MIFKNQVFDQPSSGQRIRVLGLERETRNVWCFDLTDPKGLPFAYSETVFQAAINAGAFIEPAIKEATTGISSPSPAAAARRDAAYECIRPLVDTDTFDICYPSKRSILIKARAKQLDCTEPTIYAYLRAWWRNGQNKNGLIPNFKHSGNRGGTTARRGRPPKHHEAPIFQITEHDQTLFKGALEQYYLKSEVVTINATYQRLLENHYSYVDSEGCRRLNSMGEYPTETQFRRFVRKTLPKEIAIRKRKGDAHFELNHRPKLGSLRHQTYTVGDAYEIDATIADVFLVHADDRSKIIGKPTLYTIRDRKSNLVTGFYAGLESASWPAAMHAIKNICEDKAALCKRYNVPYDPTDWPADGILPKTFIADRGAEMLYESSTQLAEGLGITVLNTPARRGDWKPHVECGFKQLQHSMADSMPGYTPPENFGKRQVKDYSQDAALTLHEFGKLFLLEIIRTNRAAMAHYVMPNKYVLDALQPTPINLWNAEIRDRAGLLSKFSEAEVRFALLPRIKASVCREGIRIGSCYYSAPEALAKGWFVAACRGEFKVDVSYDRRLVDAIYVHDDIDPSKYFVGQLLDKCSYLRGKSFAEVEALDQLKKRISAEGEHQNRQLKSEVHATTDPMIKAAVRAAKLATKGQSRSSRKKDTVVAREDARHTERKTNAQITPDVSSATPAKVIQLPAAKSNAATPKQPSMSIMQKKYQDLLNGL